MEKKIGEIFEYNRVVYRVVEDADDLLCGICHFTNDSYSCEYINREICNCDKNDRYDGKDVVFLRVDA